MPKKDRAQDPMCMLHFAIYICNTEKVVEEGLIDLMTEGVMSMSTGVQESSMRGLPTSPSTDSGDGKSWPLDEK